MAVATMEERVVINLSELAASKLLALMDEKGLTATHALRVFVSGGGCSGLQYGMAFDNDLRQDDTVFEQHGLRVAVDPRSLPYMAGSSIDFVDGPMGGGFHIENPNAVSGCGCGQSRDADGGCSGCG